MVVKAITEAIVGLEEQETGEDEDVDMDGGNDVR